MSVRLRQVQPLGREAGLQPFPGEGPGFLRYENEGAQTEEGNPVKP